MANEMTVTISVSYANGSDTWVKDVISSQHDVSAVPRKGGVQNIGTSAENIDKGDITTVGFGFFRNLDGTNFVEIGYDDTGFKNLIKLKAGEEAWIRLAQNTPQAKADTSAVNLEYMLFSD